MVLVTPCIPSVNLKNNNIFNNKDVTQINIISPKSHKVLSLDKFIVAE